MKTFPYDDRIGYTTSGFGRPGIDQSNRMHRPQSVKNGTRVLLRGIRVQGSTATTDVRGYFSNVTNGVAKVETWGALKKPVFLPVSALTFYKGK